MPVILASGRQRHKVSVRLAYIVRLGLKKKKINKKANKQSKMVHAYNTRTTRGSRVKVSLSYIVQSEPGLSEISCQK